MSVNEKGFGEIADEICTLALKVSHDVDFDKSSDRMQALLRYIETLDVDKKTKLVLSLFCVNGLCWLSQDSLKKHDNPIITKAWALSAQMTNKARNTIMGELNDGTGIVTTKSY